MKNSRLELIAINDFNFMLLQIFCKLDMYSKKKKEEGSGEWEMVKRKSEENRR
jgi:hypothetical protein